MPRNDLTIDLVLRGAGTGVLTVLLTLAMRAAFVVALPVVELALFPASSAAASFSRLKLSGVLSRLDKLSNFSIDFESCDFM